MFKYFIKQKSLLLSMIIMITIGCKDNNLSDDLSHQSQATFPQTNSFVKKIITESTKNVVDFKDYIYDEDIDSINVTPIIESGNCILERKSTSIFSVYNNEDEICIVNYNTINSSGKSAIDNAAFLSLSSVGTVQYPVLTDYSASIDEPLIINVLEELQLKDPTLDLSGATLGETFTTGVGYSDLDSVNNNITFIGTEFGVANILYTIIDSTSSELLGYGRIDISVSSSLNTQPEAHEVLYPDIITPNVEYLVDLSAFSPSPISDPDKDELQLIDVNSFEGNFRFDDDSLYDVNNKKFYVTFPFSSANVQDVSYTITDHKGGYATNIIRFRIKQPSVLMYWRDIYYKNYKRFFAPLTSSLMELIYPIYTSNLEDDLIEGEEFYVSTANFDTAKKYCSSRGARLPRDQELTNLYSLKGNLFVSDHWPHKLQYWASSGNSFNIETGELSTTSEDEEIYFSCVKGGLESVITITDGSIADGTTTNQTNFLVEDVYGVGIHGENVFFSSNEDTSISFLPGTNPGKTDVNGIAKSIFNSVDAGSYVIKGTFIDDILSTTSYFESAPAYSVAILGTSDSCNFGKCTPMRFNYPSTVDNIALVNVRVTEDGSSSPEPGVSVKINSKSSDGVLFSSVDQPGWSESSVCVTDSIGSCTLKVASLSGTLSQAHFVVSIESNGEHPERSDYISYSSLMNVTDGTFDQQLTLTGKKDSEFLEAYFTIDDKNLYFVPGNESPNFNCIGPTDWNSEGAKACKYLYTSHMDPDHKYSGGKMWEDIPEANSTFAKTGSGSKVDGDNRYLVAYVQRDIDSSGNLIGGGKNLGIEYTIRIPSTVPTGSFLKFELDWYNPGAIWADGGHYGATDGKLRIDVEMTDEYGYSYGTYTIPMKYYSTNTWHHSVLSGIPFPAIGRTVKFNFRFHGQGALTAGTYTGFFMIDNLKANIAGL